MAPIWGRDRLSEGGVGRREQENSPLGPSYLSKLATGHSLECSRAPSTAHELTKLLHLESQLHPTELVVEFLVVFDCHEDY